MLKTATNVGNSVTIGNMSAVAAVTSMTFAPLVGERVTRRRWIRGAGFSGQDVFYSAQERAEEALSWAEEEQRQEALRVREEAGF